MKKRIIFANILLLLCMVALTYKLKQDWEQWDKENSLQTLMQRVKTVEPEVQVPEVKTAHAHRWPPTRSPTFPTTTSSTRTATCSCPWIRRWRPSPS